MLLGLNPLVPIKKIYALLALRFVLNSYIYNRQHGKYNIR